MFYLIDTHGTTKAVLTEPIYQGSVGVNNVVLFAPFPANVQVTMYARLPNGISLRNPYVLTAQAYPEGAPILRDEYGNTFTAFAGTIHESMTEFAGLVEVQFKVIEGVGRVLGTYTTSFNVTEGVITDPISIPTDEDYLNAVLQYLAELNSDPLKSVIYKADNDLILPSTVTGGATINTDPNATVNNINGNGYFVATQKNPPLTFAFTYNTPFYAQLVQFWMNSPTVAPIEITINASLNGATVVTQILTIENTASTVNINPRAYLGSVKIDKIEFTVDSPDDVVYIKGVQVFKQNVDGEYVFTMKSGAQAVINAPDGKTIESYFLRASAAAQSAETSATSAENSATQASASAESASQSESNAASYKNKASAYADQASTSASSASNSAAEAYRYLEIFMSRQRVYYEATLGLALGAIANTITLYDGDLFIIGQKEVPDLVVFENTSEALANAPSITIEQIQNGTYPKISAGDKYKIAGDRAHYGFIALETGIDTGDFITREELGVVADSLSNAINTLYNKVGNLESQMGDVQTALTNIIALQNSYINGGNA